MIATRILPLAATVVAAGIAHRTDAAARDLAGRWEWTAQSPQMQTAGSMTFVETNGRYSGTGTSTGEGDPIALRVDSVTVKGDSVIFSIESGFPSTHVRGAFSNDSVITGKWTGSGDAAGTFEMRKRARTG